ncbi:LRR domain containing protein [Trema orientale]|uniref:LRR domain containing protein n=1 Tax=Trema orientale TaxID=63057 RepID=A0A2P5F490_TREOI|nr:LRR domain containing protein [Trema orientale]
MENGDRVIKLPETMCNLFNLQTLELIECVVALPKGIGKLVNLRHLCLGEPIILPKGLGKLTSLETLDCIKISKGSHASFKKVMKLKDLRKLIKLKGCLSIYIGNVKDVEEAERAQLEEKEGLVDLVLDLYGLENMEDSTGQSVLLLEGLQPHPNLKRLEIRHYYGTTKQQHLAETRFPDGDYDLYEQENTLGSLEGSENL